MGGEARIVGTAEGVRRTTTVAPSEKARRQLVGQPVAGAALRAFLGMTSHCLLILLMYSQ